MRFATYNVHDCIGGDRRFDPARTVDVVAELEADLIALQEVTLDGAGDLVGRFERATGLKGIDATLFDRGVGRYGNLVLTRYPVSATRMHDISFLGREPRGVVEVLLDGVNGPFKVFATHLGLRMFERRAQFQHLLAMLNEDDCPAVLVGDLNTWGWSAPMRQLNRLGFRETVVRSYPTRPWPLAAVDRILARYPLIVTKSWRYDGPLARVASDHFPVLAEVQFNC